MSCTQSLFDSHTTKMEILESRISDQQAEIERLRKTGSIMEKFDRDRCAQIDAKDAEIERLRGEILDWNTRWKEQCHVDGFLEAEIERLENNLDLLRAAIDGDELVKQEAEIKRLRAKAELCHSCR